jgi:glycosyltransferase involved in cell wall biosynthesis
MARLLFVTGTPTNVRGGSGTYVGIAVLRAALAARGHEVTLLAPAAGPRPFGMTAARLWFNFRARHAATALRPDVVVGFDLDGVFMVAPKVRQVAAIKGVLAEELQFERGMVRATLRLQAYFERQHVRRAERVLTTSAYAADRISGRYGVEPRRLRIVPELIDLTRWRSALASALGGPEAAPVGPVILCVAHLYPRKDVATLLRALARLPAARLRVVGVGPELVGLRRLARALALGERVAFLEHVPFGQLAAEYRQADLFCLPSRQEGFGIVFLEAMAAGLPIVAARAAAVPEVVADREAGVLVPPGDVAALAEALGRLLADRRERERLGGGGRKRVWRYDAPLVAAQFEKAIGVE